MHIGEMKLIKRLHSMLLTFIIFQATVSTYFLSALQTEKISKEGWFGKRERFLKSALPVCISL